MAFTSLVLLLGSLIGAVSARLPDVRSHANFVPFAAAPRVSAPSGPVTDVDGTALPPLDTVYEFDQLIDHDNPQAGTFKQRYYHTWQYYVAGGPIVLMTVGEANMEGYLGYLSNGTISGRIAQDLGGAGIVLEHRFFGLSNPKPDLSDDSLALLTLDQSVADHVYFAENVKLAMPGGDQVTPDKAAWILVGGSYPGALVSYIMNTNPGVFWAGYSSSGTVQTILDFWGYFEPIRQYGPQNCTADIEAVIAHVDEVFTLGSPAEIQALKENWGMGNVTHLDDVAGALRFNLFDWQQLTPESDRSATFYVFCDALEVKDGVPAGPEGWGLQNALSAWGNFWKTRYLQAVCGNTSDIEACLGTYDPTKESFHDTRVNNAVRSWRWMVCNEIGFFFTGAPVGWPSLTTRLITPSYDIRQCAYWFDKKFILPTPPDTARTNLVYKGWEGRVDRLFFANGLRDPWREGTMSTDFVDVQSTDTQPIALSDGFHCSDMVPTTDLTVRRVQDLGLAYMSQWMAEWHAAHPASALGRPHSGPNPDSLPRLKFTRLNIPASVLNATAHTPPKLPVTAGGSTGDRSVKWAVPDPLTRDPIEL